MNDVEEEVSVLVSSDDFAFLFDLTVVHSEVVGETLLDVGIKVSLIVDVESSIVKSIVKSIVEEVFSCTAS